MEQYLAHTYYALWEVILNSNSTVQMTKDEAGNKVEVPPITAQQILSRKRERKAKSTLLMAILDEHLARFHGIKDAKTLWAAIKTRFGEVLDKGYDIFQRLLSLLEIHGVGVSTKDANQKFLRSIPSACSNISLIMRNKPGKDNMDIDDPYNNLKSMRLKLMALLDHPPTHRISPQLDNKDLEQIDQDDLEEMDLKWQLVLTKPRLSESIVIEQDTFPGTTDQPGTQETGVKMLGMQGTEEEIMVKEEEATDFAFMAFTSNSSSSSSSNSEREKLRKTNQEIMGYQYGLESIEGQLRVSTLLMAILDKHLARFHGIKDAKTLWAAIKPDLVVLDKGYDIFQRLLSLLEIHGVGVSTKDANQKFLRSIPSACSNISLIMRNKPGKDNMDIDDPYNNLKSMRLKLMALLDHPPTHRISPQLDNKHLEQIDQDDLEEMDLKWQLVLTKPRLSELIVIEKDTFPGTTDQPGTQETGVKMLGMQGTEEEIMVKEEEVTETVFDNRSSDEENSLANDRFKKDRMAKKSVLPNNVGKRTGHKECRPVWNHVQRINHQNKFAQTAVFTRFGRIPVSVAKPKVAASTSAAKPVNTDGPKQSVHFSKSKRTFHKLHSPIRRSFYNTTRRNSTERVNTAGSNAVSAVKGNRVTAVKTSSGSVWRPRVNDIDHISKDNRWICTRVDYGHPQQALKNKGILDSGCSRHMTGNKSYLADYQEINDGGFVAFGSSKGKITGTVKIRTENFAPSLESLPKVKIIESELHISLSIN
nr:ribonuclease H-like domain-containing protein [Tanacetum cinerariifolium]